MNNDEELSINNVTLIAKLRTMTEDEERRVVQAFAELEAIEDENNVIEPIDTDTKTKH